MITGYEGEFDLKAAVVAGLKARLPADQNNMAFRVIKSYPFDPALLPCISVTQAGGSLGNQTLGEDYGDVQLDGEWFAADGAQYRQSVSITVWAHNTDLRDMLARATRKALWRLLKELSDIEGLAETNLTESGDEQDFELQAPKDVHMFTFTLSALTDLVELTPLGPDTSVEVTLEFGP